MFLAHVVWRGLNRTGSLTLAREGSSGVWPLWQMLPLQLLSEPPLEASGKSWRWNCWSNGFGSWQVQGSFLPARRGRGGAQE